MKDLIQEGRRIQETFKKNVMNEETQKSADEIIDIIWYGFARTNSFKKMFAKLLYGKTKQLQYNASVVMARLKKSGLSSEQISKIRNLTMEATKNACIESMKKFGVEGEPVKVMANFGVFTIPNIPSEEVAEYAGELVQKNLKYLLQKNGWK